MKKLISKFLFLILAIVVAFCGLIVACAMDPTIAKEVSAFAKSHNLHIEIKKSEEEELAAAAAASRTSAANVILASSL